MTEPTIGRASNADYRQIVGDISDFWGSDRTLGMHNAMYVNELVDSSFVIKEADRVLAYLFGVVAEPRRVAYVALIGVRASHRRHGFGQHLYRLFEDPCPQQGLHAADSRHRSIKYQLDRLPHRQDRHALHHRKGLWRPGTGQGAVRKSNLNATCRLSMCVRFSSVP
jgi:GNAT superfamily N-acetyltransferase